MIRSLLLFAHIAGMLTLFAGLALELVSSSLSTRVNKALPRVYGIALGLILLSGIVMAARVGVHQFAWVRLSFVTMLLIGILGRFRSRASIHFRIALGLAVVYLMISKIALSGSLIVIATALLAAAMITLYNRQPSGA